MDANEDFHQDDKLERVCVVGMGYIGLPTAAVLANSGMRVLGCDTDDAVVDTVNRGEIHIHEPQLDALVEDVVRRGTLSCSTAPDFADTFILCVPTPVRADKTPDLRFVEAAARSIKPYVRPGNLVILESTSPPGSTENIVAKHAIPEGLQVGEDIFVAHCPERVLPGRILHEAIHNDRIVGGLTEACTTRACEFYERFVLGQVLGATALEAELAKLAENACRDVNIAFANELSLVADTLGADVWNIIKLANRHPRVDILKPGPGVGGHCISVDPWFLVAADPIRTPLMQTARCVNDGKPDFFVDKIAAAAAKWRNPTIGCLGLAYKPNVDDIRESPSLEIVRRVSARRLGNVLVCEPYLAAAQLPEFALFPLEHVVENADILVLLTDHDPFLEIDPELLREKTLIDTRGVWNIQALETSAPSVLSRRVA